MEHEKKTVIFIIGFILAGLLISYFFPKETKKNPDAILRIGAGDDISGLLMRETVKNLEGKYELSDTLESTSFQDC